MKENNPIAGTKRIVIENVWPEIDGGRFAIKRCVQDLVSVEANIFGDGHDYVSAILKYRPKNTTIWQSKPFHLLGNDRWQAKFTLKQIGQYEYTIQAWINHFITWRHNIERWLSTNQDISVELQLGIQLIEHTKSIAEATDAEKLGYFSEKIKTSASQADVLQYVFSPELLSLMNRYIDADSAVDYSKILSIWVDREKARFSSWYELFPRSLGKSPHEHGTLIDLIHHLPYIHKLGFDVVYLPPIHPIGKSYRKGKNNNPQANPEEPGSPWGIGSAEGGHKAIHPQLGTIEDFDLLITQLKAFNMEIALDFAIQCTPDHPYVQAHADWFKKRPDGSIQYAENPPKKYQDIYPVYFQNNDWQSLWQELKSILIFWINHGVKIFRVDNPHTKAFVFWEWVIKEIKQEHPDIIFLSEAFTKPSVMYYLAKLGFSQSYTYFTWRNSKPELINYFTELTKSPVSEFFRPNAWPNTPDILHEYLQNTGKAGFIIRLVLAATLSSNYGIYGPAYELLVNQSREENSEEYLHSEKYEIKQWDINDPQSIQALITRVNLIRNENPALHRNDTLEFHSIDNEKLICYTKHSLSGNNLLLIVVNLDSNYTESGWLTLPIEKYGIQHQESFPVHDLLNNEHYIWQGERNFIKLDPHHSPAHIFLIQTRIHHEQDYEGYS